ncbi:MAG: ABC transporter ATP-binding protein [Ruminococcaceae bacterium]|nr:ABC transporter ATP-binding protein [Oscillospiraceae bacterium]
MMLEVLADLCLPRLMTVIVDCGIAKSGDVSDVPFASFIMKTLFGEGSYTSMQVIITFGVLMLLTVIVGGMFGISCAFTAARASQGLGHDLRRDAYSRVMSLSIEQTDKFTTGSLVTRMTNDVSMIVDFTEMILRMFVRAPIFFVGGAIMLLTLDLSFGAILLCALPIMLLTLFLVMRKTIPIFAGVQKRLDKVNSVVQENVSGARVVKAYVKEDYEVKRFEEANRDLRDTNYSVMKIMAVLHPVLHIVMNLSILVIIYIGGFKIENVGGSGMTAGTIMAAITYVTQVLMSIMMVTMMTNSISRAMASLKRVNEVLDTEPAIKGGADSAERDDVAISLKGVSFQYPNTVGRPVLHDIDLEVKRGETVAIIGATGSGKTSLVNLIPRFYDATEGEVMVDGLNVKEYDLEKLRSKISFVMQKSELFSDTIANNIRWGKPDADEDEIRSAIEVAQAQSFVEGFNDRYDTFIAEKGASLSGGQKQRMSIARAIVREPEILILDDSTSALDLATEAKLRAALNEKFKDTTVIMIAQRIASVREADRIAVIENGTIIACAPHSELMQSCETYRDIYNSQMQNGGGINE